MKKIPIMTHILKELKNIRHFERQQLHMYKKEYVAGLLLFFVETYFIKSKWCYHDVVKKRKNGSDKKPKKCFLHFSFLLCFILRIMVLKNFSLVHVLFVHGSTPVAFIDIWITPAKAYPCQTSKMECFAKIFKRCLLLTIFSKCSILDAWLGFEYEYASAKLPSQRLTSAQCFLK